MKTVLVLLSLMFISTSQAAAFKAGSLNLTCTSSALLNGHPFQTDLIQNNEQAILENQEVPFHIEIKGLRTPGTGKMVLPAVHEGTLKTEDMTAVFNSEENEVTQVIYLNELDQSFILIKEQQFPLICE